MKRVSRKKNVKVLEEEKAANELLAKKMVNEMDAAYEDDLASLKQKKPALAKLKMLPKLEALVKKTYLHEALLSQGVLTMFARWMKPAQKGSLPSLEVRSKLLELLVNMNDIKWHNYHDDIRDSNIGRVIKYILKHPKEIPQNKQNAKKLVDLWTHSIIAAESDPELNYDRNFPLSPLEK